MDVVLFSDMRLVHFAFNVAAFFYWSTLSYFEIKIENCKLNVTEEKRQYVYLSRYTLSSGKK